MKIACIVQGNLRRGSDLVLREMTRHFDMTILSTWEDEANIPPGNFLLVKSVKPVTPGINSRNLQRKSTALGIEIARNAGCDYILKWRSDMLPTNLNVDLLLSWANEVPPSNFKSRLVMPAFRTITHNPDYFSTIPDLFCFGHTEEIFRLWGDEGFNYQLEFNVPNNSKIYPNAFMTSEDWRDFYCPEAELYSIYKSRLEAYTERKLTHGEIAIQFLRLIDYRALGIIWFDSQEGFRSIGQAWEHPWWTEADWLKKEIVTHPYGRPRGGMIGHLKRKRSKFKVSREVKLQEKLYKRYMKESTS